jgi:hypothetical protein
MTVVPQKKRFVIFSFTLRLIVSCSLISTIFVYAGPYYVQALLPIIKKQIQWFHSDYILHTLTYDEQEKSQEIAVDISIIRPFTDTFGKTGNWRDVSYSIHASTLYSHPIIMFSLLMAWPGLSIKRRILSTAFGIILLFLAVSLDHPFHLISQAERGLIIDSFLGKMREFWVFMLTNGGRQLISVLMVLLAISYEYVKLPEPLLKQPIHRNDPCPCGSGKKYKRCCGQSK